MKKFILFLILSFLTLGICNYSYALSDLLINPSDRILILAPHPDDEAIGTGGIIQKAVESNIPIKIAYLTNGENNELSFLIYKKHPVLSKPGLLKMGAMRREESTAAMQLLGLNPSQLIFLGYPDFGTMQIFTKYWGNSKPYKSMLTKVTSVPYKNAYTYEASYKGESILADLENILLDFRPTKIFVTLPADTNGDHRAIYLFLQVSLWNLEGKIPMPDIYPYLIHAVSWPLPRGFHSELSLELPEALSNLNLDQWRLELTPTEIEKKKSAIQNYKSQNAYNHKYLYTFARKNEIFARFHDIVLKESADTENIDWEKYIRSQNIIPALAGDTGSKKLVQSAAYILQKDKLLIRLVVNHWESEVSGINIFLFGYKKSVPFADMPKIRVKVNFDRLLSVYNGLSKMPSKDIKFSFEKNDLLIELPLSILNNPDKILSSFKIYVTGWPLETTPWRTLILESDDKSQ